MGIVGWEFKEYIKNKRFRFAFFDGCHTAGSIHLCKAFGATDLEFQKSMTFDEIKATQPTGPPYDGPMKLEDYQARDSTHPDRLGIRPGLFLGWRYLAIAGHILNPPQQD